MGKNTQKIEDQNIAQLIPLESLRDLLQGLEAEDEKSRLSKIDEQTLQDWLRSECAWYLLQAKRGEQPLDSVACFHFSNGALLHRINWMADTSRNGFQQSTAMMVNYLYAMHWMQLKITTWPTLKRGNSPTPAR